MKRVALFRHLRSELLPALEEVLGRHLCGLEELVEHHGEFHCNVLKRPSISVHTHTHLSVLILERMETNLETQSAQTQT